MMRKDCHHFSIPIDERPEKHVRNLSIEKHWKSNGSIYRGKKIDEEKEKKIAMIVLPNAVVHPNAMMIMFGNTPIITLSDPES